MKYQRISITLDPTVLAQAQARKRDDNVSGAINESLSRYYEALRRARLQLQSMFSNEEKACLLDICNGTIFESWSIPLLYASVEDSPEACEKWKVIRLDLTRRLSELTYIQAAALVDAIERYWRSPEPRPEIAEVLA